MCYLRHRRAINEIDKREKRAAENLTVRETIIQAAHSLPSSERACYHACRAGPIG